ncbi:MAG: hypothetical protein WC438_04155 [Candidatus Pacearchaeota archaeon]
MKHPKCQRCKKRKATGIIRQKAVCNDCYDLINKDNYFRIKEGKSIPKDFSIFIELDKNNRRVRKIEN